MKRRRTAYITSLFFLLTLCTSAWAQSPQSFLGKTYNSMAVTSLLQTFKTDSAVESFLPYQKAYHIDYPQDGIYMDFNSDISLYRIALFDSGYSYNSYKNELPFEVQWGMTLPEVEKKTGALDFDELNLYIRTLITEDFAINFYFLDGKLNHIKLTATQKRLTDLALETYNNTGIRLLPEGRVLSGNVVDGTGTMMWGNGAATYQGEWSYGLPHGKGQYIDSFGNKYDGEFKLGFFWGQARFFSETYKYSYTGEFVMGKKHNKGRITYANKTAYDGQWFQDNMHGYGTYFAGKNYVYQGMMQNNAFNGKGALQTPQGIITGTFKNGKPHGICTQQTLDGLQSVKGNYVNGKKNGKFTININGTISTIEYENDIEIAKGPVDPTKIK